LFKQDAFALMPGPAPGTDNPLDHHYYNLREEMRRLFRTLNIAA
jgi:hypothetical protein